VWLETVVTLGRKDLLVQEVKLVIPVPRVSRDNSSLSGALLEKFLDVQVTLIGYCAVLITIHILLIYLENDNSNQTVQDPIMNFNRSVYLPNICHNLITKVSENLSIARVKVARAACNSWTMRHKGKIPSSKSSTKTTVIKLKHDIA